MPIVVVIPALEEADRIADTVRRAAAPGVEVVVVDGGSRDGTAACARDAGARVLASPPGRARQFAAGVAATSADTSVFLHADTALPPGWEAALVAALAAPGVVGGAFRFGFATDEPAGGTAPAARASRLAGLLLGFVALGAQLRVRLFHLPYGDQAIFATRAALAAAGGVPQVPLMEDLDLVRALQRQGRFVMLSETARTSPRRYLAGGVLRVMLRHWIAAAAWSLGVDRARIAAWHRRGAGGVSAAARRAAALSGARPR